MAQFDLVIRGGTLVDGDGGEPYEADIAITGDRIVAIGPKLSAGQEEIDATGRLVTPGFVDVHSHFDGQATWDSFLYPSTRHGATTVMMGNCGVGFAPCRERDRETLIEVMEGVEDIPGAALHEGLPWNWESFPEFLDAVDSRPHDADIAALVPHGALRVFVMGDRAVAREQATQDDIAAMRSLMRHAIDAGAIGLGTSRTMVHRSRTGDLTPMYGSAYEEITGICSGFDGRAIFQLVSDWDDEVQEFGLLRAAVEAGASSATFSLVQWENKPEQWRHLLAMTDEANADGIPIWAQTLPRWIGGIHGLEASFHPFALKPSYRSIAGLTNADRLRAMRDPDMRRRLLSEEDVDHHQVMPYFRNHPFERLYMMEATPNYVPADSDSVAARAQASGVEPLEYIYDKMMDSEGKSLIMMPMANFIGGSIDPVGELLQNPHVISSLGDGGAHVASICDASTATFLLSYWARDRKLLSIGEAVAKLTANGADLIGLGDRGRLHVGLRADINVIDLDRLGMSRPHIVNDLPAGGARYTQESTGYDATILAGRIVARHGESTGELPGRVVRGQRDGYRPATAAQAGVD